MKPPVQLSSILCSWRCMKPPVQLSSIVSPCAAQSPPSMIGPVTATLCLETRVSRVLLWLEYFYPGHLVFLPYQALGKLNS